MTKEELIEALNNLASQISDNIERFESDNKIVLKTEPIPVEPLSKACSLLMRHHNGEHIG